jgi:hypothetical protein
MDNGIPAKGKSHKNISQYQLYFCEIEKYANGDVKKIKVSVTVYHHYRCGGDNDDNVRH